MSLSTEVKTLLTTISNVYIGSMPATPNDCVAIYNTGGYPRGLTATELEQVTFQIRVRSTSYATGETLCNTICDLLHGHSTTKILLIKQQSGILDLGRDESNRQEFSINFETYFKR